MDIKDRIAKVLALANSPNENEAKAALLKARELMAKYKLRPEEIGDRKKEKKVIRRVTEVTCTKMTDPWIILLSSVIAEHYCCVAYRNHAKRAKVSTVGFIGLEDDFAVCEKIFLYAVDCVKSQAAKLAADRLVPSSQRREMANTYGWGFCVGLKAAFEKQQQENQEWGLVLAIPSEVSDAVSEMGKPQPYCRASFVSKEMAQAGYSAGFEFDPHSRLESSGGACE